MTEPGTNFGLSLSTSASSHRYADRPSPPSLSFRLAPLTPILPLGVTKPQLSFFFLPSISCYPCYPRLPSLALTSSSSPSPLKASGSAYLELEHTKVLVAVYGPKPRQDVEFSEDGKLLCDFRYAPFARLVGGHRQKKERGGRDGGGGGGPQQEEERAASQVIAQALEASAQLAKLPKSVIEIYVSVLQADGGEVGAAITCASLALADAGIELFGLVASCGVVAAATAPSSGGGRGGWRVHLDPTATEEEDEGGREGEGGVLGLALMPASGEVTQLWQEGRLDGTAMERALEVATDGALMVHAMMRKRLLKAVVSAAGGGGEGGRRSSSSSSLLLSSS